jgi:hypothetical protein
MGVTVCAETVRAIMRIASKDMITDIFFFIVCSFLNFRVDLTRAAIY